MVFSGGGGECGRGVGSGYKADIQVSGF